MTSKHKAFIALPLLLTVPTKAAYKGPDAISILDLLLFQREKKQMATVSTSPCQQSLSSDVFLYLSQPFILPSRLLLSSSLSLHISPLLYSVEIKQLFHLNQVKTSYSEQGLL